MIPDKARRNKPCERSEHGGGGPGYQTRHAEPPRQGAGPWPGPAPGGDPLRLGAQRLLDIGSLFRQTIYPCTPIMELIHQEFSCVYHYARTKIYPSGYQVMAASRPIFRPPGWECSDTDSLPKRPKPPEPAGAALSEGREQGTGAEADTLRSRRRARTIVRDLARCNEFKYFVTLTLDETKIDRYDIKAITKKLNSWLDNRVRRNGLAYVLIPEYHKDRAIHFHGFFNDALAVEYSGTVIPPGGTKPRKPRSRRQLAEWIEGGGRIVYNLPSWGYGFTSAMELYGDYEAAISYVCKYITKSEEKVGGRWYYSGGALKKPRIVYDDIMAQELALEPGVYTSDLPEANVTLAIKEWWGCNYEKAL